MLGVYVKPAVASRLPTASCLDVVHVSLRPVSESRAVGGVYDVRSKTQCVARVFQMQKLWKHIKHKYENKE